MGQKAAVFEKKPELIKAILEDPRLLKMVGVKSTSHSPGYTERYDHGTIPISSLKEMVNSPNFSVEDFKNRISQSPENNNQDIDMSKFKDMMDNMDMTKLQEMVGSQDMSKIGDLVKNMDPEKLRQLTNKVANQSGNIETQTMTEES